MDCLKKKVFLFPTAFLLAFLMLPFVSSKTFAAITYTSVTLSPSTGTIWSDNTALSVYVNSGTSNFAGVDLDLDFTGSVDYVSSTGASVCNSSFLVTEGTGNINIECLSSQGATYSGVIATLYFKSTAAGTSVFTFTNNDSSITITTLTGGTYTVSTSSHPCGAGASASCTDPSTIVPQTGLFDNSRNAIIFGVFLLIVGIFWNKINDFAYDTLGRMKENRVKKDEEKVEKRRSKWESKF